MENNIILKHYGRLYNPTNWGYYPNYLTNRVYYVCGGEALYKDSVKLTPGHVYIFKPDADFRVTQDASNPFDHIYFDFVSAMQVIGDDVLEIDIATMPRLKAITDALSCDFSLDSYPMSVAESYLNVILYELRDYLIINRAYSPLTLRALRFIHESSPSELNVARLADSMCINVNHLIRTFRRETGITPLKYIALIKSELAINYIRKGYSFEEIAYNLGYSSVSSLSVAFKNTMHRNLSEFK